MAIRRSLAAAVGLALAGCASTTWQHTEITDPSRSARQLVIDDGYCKQVALGAAPMPQVVIAPGATTTSYQGTATVRNPQTGVTSYGTYSGQATTTPANSFATGFANGMNMGAAIAARRAQDDIHKSCMFAKGWSDTPITAITKTSTAAPAVPILRASLASQVPRPPAKVYANAKEEWDAETAEFLSIYPAYREQPRLSQINSRVIALAKSDAGRGMSGPQILLKARQEMIDAGLATVEAASEEYDLVRSTYRDAAAGKPLAQAGMGLLYSQGGTGVGVNHTRAAAWAQKSAEAGNAVGQMGFGILRFGGNGVQQDKADGYRWVKKAAVTDPGARQLLTQMESEMTAEELRAVK